LASANIYRFSSKEIHVNSGLYYYGYRFYDSATERWINRDPLQDWALGQRVMPFLARAAVSPWHVPIPPYEKTWGPNLYAFVGNGPANWFDFNGMLTDGPFIPPPKGYDPKNWPPPICSVSTACKAACVTAGAAGITLTCPEEGPAGVVCIGIWMLLIDACAKACDKYMCTP